MPIGWRDPRARASRRSLLRNDHEYPSPHRYDRCMRRRDVLQWGASGALLGCVRQEPVVPRAVAALTPSDLETLAKMDLVIQTLRTSKPDAAQFDVAVKDPARVREAHDLVAKQLATMHTVATFGAMPQETQRHPEMQRRMWAALP